MNTHRHPEPVRVLVLAGDPGGGNALVPVIRRLASDSRFEVAGFAYRQTRDVWKRHGIPFTECPENGPLEDCLLMMTERPPGLLLTATSLNGIDLEKHFITAARQLGIPSLTLLDFWSNYRPRFEDETGQLAYLPDRIAVMDEHARQEMMAAGFPATCLAVTGQPAFDGLAEWMENDGQAARDRLRSHHGMADGERLVLFASQPIAELYGECDALTKFPGYTQHTVLPLLFAALVELGKRDPGPFALWLRPHPREDVSAYARYEKEWSSGNIRVILSDAGTPLEAAVAADVMVGMNTVLLVEAALMNRITISVQPGLRGEDALPLKRLGLGQTIYNDSASELAEGLQLALAGSAVRDENPGEPVPGASGEASAVERVLLELRSLLRDCAPGTMDG